MALEHCKTLLVYKCPCCCCWVAPELIIGQEYLCPVCGYTKKPDEHKRLIYMKKKEGGE